MNNQQNEFDPTQKDKLYELHIPNYQLIHNTVYYQLHLHDLVSSTIFKHLFRFNQLKHYHEQLLSLNMQLPEFPKTHFWKKTNKNPDMIKNRKNMLEVYFNVLMNDPYTRGARAIKDFVRVVKYGDRERKVWSVGKCSEVTGVTRAKSLGGMAGRVDIKGWKEERVGS